MVLMNQLPFDLANKFVVQLISKEKFMAEQEGLSNREPSLRTLAMPADANPNGDIFGGWLLSQMDIAGASHAYRIAEGRIATVAIEGMSFHLPVYIGDEVSCYCKTKRIGNTSISVDIETWVRRRRGPKVEKVTEGIFIYVAIDDNGKPRPVLKDK